MERNITSEEVNTRLKLAEDIISNFPFLKGHFEIESQINENGGTFAVSIVSQTIGTQKVKMQNIVDTAIPMFFNARIKDLIRENEELKIKLKVHEDSISKRKRKAKI